MGQGRWGEAEEGRPSTTPLPPPTFASPYTCSAFETGAVAGGAAVALLSVTANGQKELPGNMAAAAPGRADVCAVPFIFLE